MSDTDFTMDQITEEASTGVKLKPEAGDYNVMIAEASLTANSKGTGKNAVLFYTVLDGEFQGSEFRQYLSVLNPSEQTQQISRAQLKAVQIVSGAEADGKNKVEELAGYSLRVRVTKEPHTFVNNNGNTVNTFNNNVINVMTMEGKDAKGNTVPAFVPKTETAPKPEQSSGSTSGSDQNLGKDKVDLDDEIPF